MINIYLQYIFLQHANTVHVHVCYTGALLVQQAKCALSMEKALADVKDKLAHHQQEACSLAVV